MLPNETVKSCRAMSPEDFFSFKRLTELGVSPNNVGPIGNAVKNENGYDKCKTVVEFFAKHHDVRDFMHITNMGKARCRELMRIIADVEIHLTDEHGVLDN